MNLKEFLDKENRKSIKLSKDYNFHELLEFYKSSSFSIIIQDNQQIILKTNSSTINFDDYLDKYLPKNKEYIHEQLYEYIYLKNKFIDELPIYIIRRHGTYSGDVGSRKRRRGWLVKFNNAWILYADNFVSRHFFELSYFINKDFNRQYLEFVNTFMFPFSSGGGKYEKLNRFFPTLTHLSNRSNFYLSHLYDLNKGNYNINNIEVESSRFLGRNDDKFGHGEFENWDTNLFDERKIRIIDKNLSLEEIEFLRKYNLRMLSPMNYFPFPKNNKIDNSDLNGESCIVRNYYEKYLLNNYEHLDVINQLK